MAVLSVREWVGRFEDGAFDSKDVDVQAGAGWVDWKCKDDALAAKTKSFGGLLSRLTNESLLGLEVSLKNCAVDEGLYDMLVLFDGKSNEVVLTVVLGGYRSSAKWAAYSGQDEVASAGTVVAMAKALNALVLSGTATSGRFTAPAGTLSDELRRMASADAMERFGREIEFVGIQRKYFRSAEQAGVWLDRSLPDTPEGTLLAAMHGQELVAGYSVDV